MMYGIICFSQINEASLDWVMVLTFFLHQHSWGEELVSTAPATTETTLAFMKELFCSGLELVQDGFGKHLTRYAQESRAMPP